MNKVFLEEVKCYIKTQKDEKEIFDYIYRLIHLLGFNAIDMNFNDLVKESINDEEVFNRMIYFLGDKFNVTPLSFSIPSVKHQILKKYNYHNKIYRSLFI